MNKQLTSRVGALQAPQLDYILIDGSGSMVGKWTDTMASLQFFVDVLRAENVHSHGIVSVFDSYDMQSIQRDGLLIDWASLHREPLAPGCGSTPLYDAINLMGRELAQLDPPKCSIVIITDGEENCSRMTTADQARKVLDWLRAKGYQVTFLGADFNNSHQAKLLGASDSNSIGVSQERLAEAGKLLGKKRVDHSKYGKNMNFSDDEKEYFGGYLTKI